MLQNGALEGKRVLLLGDDDSVSIAIGLLGRALRRTTQGDLTRGVTVVDADERRISFLRDAAAREQLALEVVHHDLRRPLPAGLLRAFDVIETDPPYTLEGARLFLARGCEALATEADGHCFFSFTHWPASQMLELQKVFTELGLAVRAVWPNFNRYAGASMLGNLGQLIELVHVGGAAPNCRTSAARSIPPRSIRGCASMPAPIAARRSCSARTGSRPPSKTPRFWDAALAADMCSAGSRFDRHEGAPVAA